MAACAAAIVYVIDAVVNVVLDSITVRVGTGKFEIDNFTCGRLCAVSFSGLELVDAVSTCHVKLVCNETRNAAEECKHHPEVFSFYGGHAAFSFWLFML